MRACFHHHIQDGEHFSHAGKERDIQTLTEFSI